MKAVDIETPRRARAKRIRTDLVSIARSRPDMYVCVYMKDGKVHSAFSSDNRLEMMGALQYALTEIWDE